MPAAPLLMIVRPPSKPCITGRQVWLDANMSTLAASNAARARLRPSAVASISWEKSQPASESASPWTIATRCPQTSATQNIGKAARRAAAPGARDAVFLNRSMILLERATSSSPTQSG